MRGIHITDPVKMRLISMSALNLRAVEMLDVNECNPIGTKCHAHINSIQENNLSSLFCVLKVSMGFVERAKTFENDRNCCK